jgi:hypothetical protein
LVINSVWDTDVGGIIPTATIQSINITMNHECDELITNK